MTEPAPVIPGRCECGASVPDSRRPCRACMSDAKLRGEAKLAQLVAAERSGVRFGVLSIEKTVRRAWARTLPAEWRGA